MSKKSTEVLVDSTDSLVSHKMLGVTERQYEEIIDESFAAQSPSALQHDSHTGADVRVGEMVVHAVSL